MGLENRQKRLISKTWVKNWKFSMEILPMQELFPSMLVHICQAT